MMNPNEQSRNYMVAKDNVLITKSRYSLTNQQHKILLCMISKVKKDDSKETKYEISVTEIMNICGLVNSGFYYKRIKDEIQKMSDKSTWIEVEPGKEKLFRWLDVVEYDKVKKKYTYTFHSTIAPYIFYLVGNYTQYPLKNILGLKHTYSIRLYELLRAEMYFAKKNGRGWSVTVDELKKRIDAETYERFNSFMERALIPAINEINAYTDISIEYTLEKEQRKVKSIRFTIEQKSKDDMLLTKMRQQERIGIDERKKDKTARKKAVLVSSDGNVVCEQLQMDVNVL